MKSSRLIAVAAIACVLLGVVAAIAWSLSGDEPGQPRAAIVDQLAATDPNPGFVESATRQLQAAGYVVHYYRPNQITVDFYRRLPERGYEFVLIRSHASDSINKIDPLTGKFTGESVPSIGLFTNEIYHNNLYLDDQRAGRLMVDSYADRPIKERFFGITASFVASSARGDLHGATIVLMGCSGLKTDDLAKAFVERGAGAFVSWDDAVTAQHTDEAGEALLQNLFSARLDLRQAVVRTMQDVGPDPAFGAQLAVYP